MKDINDMKIATAVLGMFIQSVNGGMKIAPNDQGEVVFTEKVIRDFLDKYSVVIHEKENPALAEGDELRSTIALRVEGLDRHLGGET